MTKKKKFICQFCKKENEGYLHEDGRTGKYCNRTCASEHRKSSNKDKFMDMFMQGKLSRRPRIYEALIQMRGNNCSCCGISEWNKKPIRLWVDHIDGNASNNKPENLRLVCPNCDSQSPYFMARNKGNGRGALGLKTWA